MKVHFSDRVPMTPTSPTLHVPSAALADLCRRYGVRELALFGSGARGELREDSDLDLLVELGDDSAIGFVGFHRLQEELEQLLGRRVDLVSKRGLNPAIRDQVLAEARVLHAA